MEKICALILLILCFCFFQLSAQNNRSVSGVVTDSTKTGIPNVKVTVISEKDTLSTSTDEEGKFSISKINGDKFSVKLSILGYSDFNAGYTFAEKEKHKRLGDLTLKMSAQMLKEVIIKAKPNPVRFMQDTVEYNAAAFQVNEGDNVADLLKQFPGMEVDDEYNVKTMGKNMVKLRVNGKDFFTNDVKEFIAKLPAAIVSKIQVIDDFGDQANFTGIKVGEPTKMLNIVTKPGMNKGKFGNLSANAGTNDMIGAGGRMNLWNNNKQSSVNANLNTSNNGAGTSSSVSLGLTHNDKLTAHTQGGFTYNFSNKSNAFSREQVMESINPEGKFVNNSKNDGKNGGNTHSMNWNINYNNKKVFIQGYLMGAYNSSDNQNSSISDQYSPLRQGLRNMSGSSASTPNINANISLSKRLKNKRNGFSARTAVRLSGNNNDQNISTNTLYYDKNTGVLKKDSLLKRDLYSKTRNQAINFGFDYSIGLKKPKDTLGMRSLNFIYNGSADRSGNEVSTFVFDNKTNAVSFVDSLSTSFNTITFNQSLGINYNYSTSKLRYNIGFNASPNLLSNRNVRLGQTTKNNTFNYSPSLNLSKILSKEKTLSLNYYGANTNPTINQLQPVRNTQSLQNIVVGNPDLKPAFNHTLNANFNYANIKTGQSLQVGINASATQRQIVDHVILVPDTLNSLKQVTRFENINGNYQVNGNYFFNFPFQKNKYSLSYSGTMGFSNRAIIFNNQKAFGKGLNFSQQFGGNMNLKNLTLNTGVTYSISNNNNSGNMYSGSEYQPTVIGQINAPAFFKTTSLSASIGANLRLKNLNLNASTNYNKNHNDATADQVVRDVSNINMRLSGRVTVKKSYFADFSASKSANYGYSLANTNPFIINTSIGKNFLKDKSLSLKVTGNDLLGQGNNISRMIAGNTVIDSRNKQQTRVFLLNLTYNLSKFGGRTFRVDAD